MTLKSRQSEEDKETIDDSRSLLINTIITLAWNSRIHKSIGMHLRMTVILYLFYRLQPCEFSVANQRHYFSQALCEKKKLHRQHLVLLCEIAQHLTGFIRVCLFKIGSTILCFNKETQHVNWYHREYLSLQISPKLCVVLVSLRCNGDI